MGARAGTFGIQAGINGKERQVGIGGSKVSTVVPTGTPATPVNAEVVNTAVNTDTALDR